MSVTRGDIHLVSIRHHGFRVTLTNEVFYYETKLYSILYNNMPQMKELVFGGGTINQTPKLTSIGIQEVKVVKSVKYLGTFLVSTT